MPGGKREKQAHDTERRPDKPEANKNAADAPATGSFQAASEPDGRNTSASQQDKRIGPRVAQWFRIFLAWTIKHDGPLHVVFASALVFFTFWQVVVGWWQWGATRDQYSAMLDQNEVASAQLAQMRLDKRAWIYAQASMAEPAADHVKFGFQYKNYGESPAKIKRGVLSNHLLKSLDDVDFDIAIKRHEKTVAAPQTKYLDILIPPGVEILEPEPARILPKGTMESVRAGNTFLLVIVTEEYELCQGDAALHKTRLCWVFDPKQDSLARYPKGNYAD